MLWNIALYDWFCATDNNLPKEERRHVTAYGQGLKLTELRKMVDWVEAVPRHVCVSVLSELENAWKRHFNELRDRASKKKQGIPVPKKMKFEKPRYKKHGKHTEIGLCEFSGAAFSIRDKRLHFPKVGGIKIVLHRPLQGTMKRCTIKRECDEWYASISCELDIPIPEPKTSPMVGIDRGVVYLVADSDGKTIPNPRILRSKEQQLARAQRKLKKKEKRSNNRKKAIAKVARCHKIVARERKHIHHNISVDYARRYGTVVVEKLQIANMTKSAKGTEEEPGTNVKQKAGLNKAILDAGWGALVTMLDYKLAERGGYLLEVKPQYTSQTCSVCGWVDKNSRKSQARFECQNPECMHSENADLNAAKVILQRAQCGEVIPPKEKKSLGVPRRGKKKNSAVKATAVQPVEATSSEVL
jgi:putative transposase